MNFLVLHAQCLVYGVNQCRLTRTVLAEQHCYPRRELYCVIAKTAEIADMQLLKIHCFLFY